MAKQCKNCHQCRGMCMNTWEPLDGISGIEKVLIVISIVLFISGVSILVLY